MKNSNIYRVMTLLVLVFIILCTSCKKEPEQNIPDTKFLESLIRSGIDTDGDGYICSCEAESVESLDLEADSITDLSGIEMFINLKSLNCSSNRLGVIDVTNLSALTYLNCSDNKLSRLDVSHNPLLLLWNVITTT